MISTCLPDEILAGLRSVAGENDVRLEMLSESGHPGMEIRGVAVYPSSAAAVGAIIRWAHKVAVPVFVREPGAPPGSLYPVARSGMGEEAGTGSSTTVIIISLEDMKNVRHVDRDGLSLLAEPGATVDGVRREAERAGALCPTGPQASASCFIGSCARCPVTGCLADHIHGLEIVLSTGEVSSIGGRGTRDLDEYQLAYLLTRGEGRSFVITGVYLKLHSGV